MPDNSTQTPLNPDNAVLSPTLRPKAQANQKIIQAWKTILRDLEEDKENLPPEVYELEKANAERYLKEEEGHHAHRIQH